MKKLSRKFIELCHSITDKRPKTVIDHILKHGQITTDELKTLYGYNHPPRAARDVREKGISLKTIRVIGADGRKIAAYQFDDATKIKFRRLNGRTGFSKEIKDCLIKKYGCRCFIYIEEMAEPLLQIDHRVPYEVAEENDKAQPDDFMLLCASANRAKSWSCEYCENWRDGKQKSVCVSCYWASPEKYQHIATHQIRRLDLLWQNGEVQQYEQIKKDAEKAGLSLPDFVKQVLQRLSTA
jgi:hypothetical protein